MAKIGIFLRIGGNKKYENEKAVAETMSWILALETSGVIGSAAILRGRECVYEVSLGEGLRHGADLIPAAKRCVAEAGISVADLSAVAVSQGPGSYTGTRIGVMAACAVAYAAKIPVIGVSSLTALAWDARHLAKRIVLFQDARRDEVFTAVYEFLPSEKNNEPDQPESLTCLKGDCALTPEEAAALAEGEGYALVGSAIGRYEGLVIAGGVKVTEDPKAPTAGSVGLFGCLKFEQGQTEDPMKFQPVYMRRDDAPAVFERL